MSGPAPVRYKAQYTALKPGIAGNRDMLSRMRAQVFESYLDPRVIYAAQSILRNAHARGGDRLQEAQAIFDFVVSRVDYRRDPTDTDLANHPFVLLRRIETDGKAAGDCNNQATLVASLGHAVRLPIVWVLVGDDPDAYEHVYPSLDLRPHATGLETDPLGTATAIEQLLALDTAVPRPQFDLHPNRKSRWIVPALKGT